MSPYAGRPATTGMVQSDYFLIGAVFVAVFLVVFVFHNFFGHPVQRWEPAYVKQVRTLPRLTLGPARENGKVRVTIQCLHGLYDIFYQTRDSVPGYLKLDGHVSAGFGHGHILHQLREAQK